MLHNTKIIVALGSLGAVLVCLAAFLTFCTWQQGQQAAVNAQNLLEQSNLTTDAGQAEEGAESVLMIPSIHLTLPVIWEYSEEALQTTICRYQGPDPGMEGNLVLTGHDYLNGAHFGTLNQVALGAEVTLYAQDGTPYKYTVYDIVIIMPDDVNALSVYEGPYGLTLMTCASNGNRRLLVRCAPGLTTTAQA